MSRRRLERAFLCSFSMIRLKNEEITFSDLIIEKSPFSPTFWGAGLGKIRKCIRRMRRAYCIRKFSLILCSQNRKQPAVVRDVCYRFRMLRHLASPFSHLRFYYHFCRPVIDFLCDVIVFLKLFVSGDFLVVMAEGGGLEDSGKFGRPASTAVRLVFGKTDPVFPIFARRENKATTSMVYRNPGHLTLAFRGSFPSSRIHEPPHVIRSSSRSQVQSIGIQVDPKVSLLKLLQNSFLQFLQKILIF